MSTFNDHEDIVFKDRQHAGELLADFLEPKYRQANPLVLGVPRGGVQVAWYVAKRLKASLSLVIAKKLGFPGRSELGFGAIAEDGAVYISERGRNMLREEAINQIIAEQAIEIKRRVDLYRKGQPLPNMEGRTVIIVDDGIATGVTLIPVIRLCRKKKANRIIIAVPVSGLSYDPHLREADQIEVLVQPANFYAVGQVYQKFGDFSDKELLSLLEKTHKEDD